MLSRTAQALHALGGAVERADGTARLLDLHLQLLEGDPRRPEAQACADLLALVGADGGWCPDRARVLELLGYDSGSPPSVTAALAAAREAAHRAGPAVPAQVVQALEAAAAAVPPGRWRAASPPAFLAWARERAAAVAGLVDSTAPRDEGWTFVVLGRSIERAAQTARLVASALPPGAETPGGAGEVPPWPALLRACGAPPLDDPGAPGVVRALLLDRALPRSVVHALAAAERCLTDLAAPEQANRTSGEAQRRLARARTELEYSPLTDVLGDLRAVLERVQGACAAASEAVAAVHFAGAAPGAAAGPGAPAWLAVTA